MVYLFLPVDIDECASDDTNDCEHICVNTVGSYFCQCDDGYQLDTDGYSCYGKCG